MARLDAEDKIAGRTVYSADVEPEGLVHVALVRSPFPHARIRGIDAAQARATAGVLDVFTGRDLPDLLYGRQVRDVPVLAREVVRFAGERVAAVVAATREAAERGAARVRVDYEQLPSVHDALAALEPGAPVVHAALWAYPGAQIGEGGPPNLQWRGHLEQGGDVEAALAASAWTVDHVYTAAAVHQGYLEPQACVAAVAPDGRVDLWLPNKSPYRLREQLQACFDLPVEMIEVHPVAIGGDFGGKGSPMDAPLCIELARRLGRPVKLTLRYAEDLTASNPRHDMRLRVRAGCDREGRLQALDVDAVANCGAYAGFKPDGRMNAPLSSGSPYRIPALRVEVRRVHTHTVPRGNMRAPGGPQTVFAVESALDELAAAAGLQPAELRRRNLLRTGEANPQGTTWVEARGHEALDAALQAYRPLSVPAGWAHGRGLAVYTRATHAVETSLRLRSEPDGRVTAFVPFPETGTGSHTVVQRAVAGALGLGVERVAVRQLPTSGLPYDAGVGGSRVTATVSMAVEEAAAAFERQGRTGEVTVRVAAKGRSPLTSYCVQIAQVAVDPGTGQVRVLEVLTALDVAEVVNPPGHRIQLEGGTATGFGQACLEDLALADGRVGGANLGDFKLPSARDVPEYRIVLVPGGRGLGALNVKAVGEIANVPTAAAIANAVADAVGVRVRDLPVTAERVFRALPGSPGVAAI